MNNREASTLQAGVAVADITPPLGLELSGWSFGPAAGVHLPLQARAVWLEQPGPALLIVSCDLISFAVETANRIRAAMGASTGLPTDNIMLAATHTHSGPATTSYRHWGTPDEDYVEWLICRLVELAVEARSLAQPVSASWSTAETEGVVQQRTLEGAPTDPQVRLLVLRQSDGELLAVVANLACHSVALHEYRNYWSPDYPGLTEQKLQQYWGSSVPLVFLPGTAGNINPDGFAHRQPPEQKLANGERISDILSETILAALEETQVEPASPLAAVAVQADLPLAPLPETAELEQIIVEQGKAFFEARARCAFLPELDEHRARVEWAREALAAKAAGPLPNQRPIEIQALRIGSLALVAIPAEVFVEVGLGVRSQSPFARTMPVSCANGVIGYIPTPEAMAQGTYECSFAPVIYGLRFFAPEVAQVVTQACLQALGQVAEAPDA